MSVILSSSKTFTNKEVTHILSEICDFDTDEGFLIVFCVVCSVLCSLLFMCEWQEDAKIFCSS